MASLPSLLESALKGWVKPDRAPPSPVRTKANSSDYLKSRPLKIAATAPTPQPGEDPAKASELARMVESEIIPRLMLAHSPSPAAGAVDRPAALGPDSAESFARMVLSKDSDSLIAYVGTLLQAGLSMETIYMELMMPAARRLGDYWDEDSISFADVTIGLGRLQQVVRTLGWQQAPATGPDHSAPSALFAPATTEQHTFGLFIIEDAFRRAGWRTWIETSGVQADVTGMVGSHWFDLLGLSASCEVQVDAVAAIIADVRKASRNRGLLILVGGRLFMERPELVAFVGADATAPNGADALLIADKALRRLAPNA